MHQHRDAVRPDPLSTGADTPAGLDDAGSHDMRFMLLCCAPMVLFVIALALAWIAR